MVISTVSITREGSITRERGGRYWGGATPDGRTDGQAGRDRRPGRPAPRRLPRPARRRAAQAPRGRARAVHRRGGEGRTARPRGRLPGTVVPDGAPVAGRPRGRSKHQR